MIEIEIDAKQLRRLEAAVNRAGKKFSKELAAAINKTASSTKIQIGKDVRSKVAMSVAESKKPIRQQAKASAANLRTVVSLVKTRRLGLQHFGARQDKRGVSFRIDKTKGRQRINGAFQGPRPGQIKASWGGIVLQRKTKNKLPIVHLKGVSAFGTYVKNNFEKQQVALIRSQLRKEMERRIKLNILRAEGLVSK